MKFKKVKIEVFNNFYLFSPVQIPLETYYNEIYFYFYNSFIFNNLNVFPNRL